MIIQHKQFPNYKKFEIMYEGRPCPWKWAKWQSCATHPYW